MSTVTESIKPDTILTFVDETGGRYYMTLEQFLDTPNYYGEDCIKTVAEDDEGNQYTHWRLGPNPSQIFFAHKRFCGDDDEEDDE
jgi:hypothetical protein